MVRILSCSWESVTFPACAQGPSGQSTLAALLRVAGEPAEESTGQSGAYIALLSGTSFSLRQCRAQLLRTDENRQPLRFGRLNCHIPARLAFMKQVLMHRTSRSH